MTILPSSSRLRAPSLIAVLAMALFGAAMARPAGGLAGVGASVPCGGGEGGAKGLIAAIQRANSQGGGTIRLARDCTYGLSKGPFDSGHGPAGLPLITSAITIRGQDSRIVRAQGSPEFRFFEIDETNSALLAIRGLTLKNGDVGMASGDDDGGAILLGTQGSLVVQNSTLSSNAAVNGGAIAAGGGRVTITNSTLRGNTALLVDGAGGAVINIGGPVTVDSSRITGNKSSGGGGGISGQSVGGDSSLLKITDSTISDNVSTLSNGGGGINTFNNERVVIRRSTIAGNSFTGLGLAGAGGGILNTGHLKIRRSTISGNVSGRRDLQDAVGGGIANEPGATANISGTTIAANRAVGPGASGGGIASGSGLTITATIVAGNQGGNCLSTLDDGGFNLEDGHSCGFTKHAIHGNPMLASLADNGGQTQTMSLKPQSPAINRVGAKRDSCRGTVDQRGVSRPQGSRCDIGAFEVVKTKTSLKKQRTGKVAKQIRLKATVKPKAAIPGQPMGEVVFRDRQKVLGSSKLDGDKPDTASLKVRLGSGKHQLKASYKGSKLFLPSRS